MNLIIYIKAELEKHNILECFFHLYNQLLSSIYEIEVIEQENLRNGSNYNLRKKLRKQYNK